MTLWNPKSQETEGRSYQKALVEGNGCLKNRDANTFSSKRESL